MITYTFINLRIRMSLLSADAQCKYMLRNSSVQKGNLICDRRHMHCAARGRREKHKVRMNFFEIFNLGIARTHGWVELVLTVPTSSSHRSSTVVIYKMNFSKRFSKFFGDKMTMQ